MPEYQPIDYRLRCHTKRTDLPADVLRDIGEAYEEIVRLQRERDEAKRMYCTSVDFYEPKKIANHHGWDCFNTPESKLDKTLNGIIIDGGKAVPPKYEDIGDE